ncbi:MAG TPA: diguanylate cyclase [Solirubrobacteraceae bacterium]|nr:diguanylate cyclase [Solirubrobacteraceae bacterium]
MRPLALIGVVASLVLGAVAIITTDESLSSVRSGQERALQAAVGAESALIREGEREAETGVSVLVSDPLVRSLLTEAPLAAQARAEAQANVQAALAEMRRTAFIPLQSACLVARSGAQIACAPSGPRYSTSANRGFLALLSAAGAAGGGRRAETPITAPGASTQDVVSNPFISPLTGGPAVALLVPVRIGSALAGLVHMDVAEATTKSGAIIVADTPGARIELAAFSGGTLQLNNAAARLSAAGFQAAQTLPVRSVHLGSRPVRLVNGSHRALIVSLPLTFGSAQDGVAAVASAIAPVPTFFGTLSAAMLALLVISAVMLIAALAYLVVSLRRASRDLATDPLTGLRNRRSLLRDLERSCRIATLDHPARLWLLDLNGFKRYNDAFGRVAGDKMLERLAERLHAVVKGRGTAYRVGGDEFCVLIRGPLKEPQTILEELTNSLTEHGGAFDITCSAGAVAIPRDTAEPAQALLLADQRMYQEKAARGVDTTELVTAVLTAALAQRHPDLGDHSDDVAEEVEMLARAAGLEGEALALVSAAASLHDIGKLGVPDRIITKPGPLDEAEWEFIRQHTLIGERIIAAAGLPMEGVGALVRSSHERWDGTGYPDGLAGEQIPLGARIITICDAYGAMLSERSYKRPMAVGDALAELRRCAGTQFDPHLVEVFCRLIGERRSPRERTRGAVG